MKKMNNIVIPLAGEGKRFADFGYDVPKPLIIVDGKTLIEHAITTIGIPGRFIFITKKYKNEKYNQELTSILKSCAPDCIEIKVDVKHRGAADAVMFAKEYIDNDSPLYNANCDQILDWDAEEFVNTVKNNGCDSAVVLFKSRSPKHGYAEIVDNKVTKLVEKDPITDHAMVGFHYWAKGSDFVRSAEALLNNDGSDEVYISHTINALVNDGHYVYPYFIPNNEYINLGTPDDVSLYLGKVKEFYTEKPKTIFCDIDGTIIKHAHMFSEISKHKSEALAGVVSKFNEWDAKGHKVILTTARKESARQGTEKALEELGLSWDLLIMGVTSGTRVLINDKLNRKDPDRAVAVSLITDEGFLSEDWTKYGL
jgi:dTDP-glucose pyrophosphorylase